MVDANAWQRTTVRDVRRRNRSALLSTLYFDGPFSRQHLSERTGLSPATVSTVIGALVEEGVVVEAGSVHSDGGRPRVLLRVDPAYRHVIGVDVGEGRVRIELFDLSMAGLVTVDRPLASAHPDPGAVAEHIVAGVAEVTGRAGLDPTALLGIGIGVPGVVEHSVVERGVIDRSVVERSVAGSVAAQAVSIDGPRVHAQVLGWAGVPLPALVRGGLGPASADAPLFVDNDAKVLGQAELWFGAARGARHAVVALVGSGVGAAVIADGVLYRGATGSAGEWGHTTIRYGGRRCRCGARGCLEAYVGAESVLDRFRDAGGDLPDTGEEAGIAALLADPSPVAARILEETAGYLGAGIANLVNLYNPERIVLGGWVGQALGPRLLPAIEAAAAEHALRRPFERTTLQLCHLGADAVARGAATLPIAHLLGRGQPGAAIPAQDPIPLHTPA